MNQELYTELTTVDNTTLQIDVITDKTIET